LSLVYSGRKMKRFNVMLMCTFFVTLILFIIMVAVSRMEVGLIILYSVGSFTSLFLTIRQFHPKSKYNKDLMASVTYGKDLSKKMSSFNKEQGQTMNEIEEVTFFEPEANTRKRKGKNISLEDIDKDIKMIKNRKMATKGNKMLMTSAFLLDQVNGSFATMIKGGFACCREIKMIKGSELCVLDGNGGKDCFVAQEDFVYSNYPDKKVFVSINGEVFCYADNICSDLYPMAIDYIAMMVKYILMLVIFSMTVKFCFIVYKSIDRKETKEIIDEENNTKRTITKFYYWNPLKMVLYVLIMGTSIVLLIQLALFGGGPVGAEAMLIKRNNSLVFNIKGDGTKYARGLTPDPYDLISSSNWICEYDEKMYHLTGKLKSNCKENGNRGNSTFISSRGFVTVDDDVKTIMVSSPYNDNQFKIEPSCKTTSAVQLNRAGLEHCKEKCYGLGKNRKCYMVSNNLMEDKSGNQLTKKAIIPEEEISFETKIGRMTVVADTRASPAGIEFVLHKGFLTAWDDYDIESSRFEGGVIKTFEADGSELDSVPSGDCNTPGTYSRGIKGFSCTHKRREMITCPKGYYGMSSRLKNSYTCIAYTVEQANKFLPDFLNPYIDTSHIELTGGLARIYEPFTFTSGILGYNLNVEVSYLESSQDSDQVSGQDKYFIYAGIAKVTPMSKGASFPMDYWLSLELGTHGRPINWPTYSMNSGFPHISPPSFIMDMLVYPGVTDKNCRSAYQDRISVNFVHKMEIYDEFGNEFSKCINGLNSVSCDFKATATSSYIISFYYAIRAYGPAKHNIKFMDHIIDTITLTNGLTDCLDCVKVKGIFYKPNFDSVNTEVTVTGFPLTQLTTLWTKSTCSEPGFETFQFYTTHPKFGAALYLAKVAATGDMGKFTINGKCQHETINDEDIESCDGKPVLKIPIVKYTTFYSEEPNPMTCEIKDQSFICHTEREADMIKCQRRADTDERFKCTRSLSRTLEVNITQDMEHYDHFGGVKMNYANSRKSCEDCILTGVIESSHRCLWCVVVFFLLAGVGFILPILIWGIAVPIFYLNSYNMGRIARYFGIHWFIKGYEKPEMCVCGVESFNDLEYNSHVYFCSKNISPYDVVRVDDGEGKSTFYRKKFKNLNMLKEHMKLYNKMRTNKLLGKIYIMRSKVVMFTLVLWSIGNLNGVQSQAALERPTGFRSPATGDSIHLDQKYFECTSDSCEMSGETDIDIFMTDGSKFSLETEFEGFKYVKNYEIKNVKIHTLCTYDYTSMSFTEGSTRTVLKCAGTLSCSNFKEKDLFKGLLSSDKPSHLPFDASNPLKTYACPKSFSCMSPALEGWRPYTGCWSANDGITVGYKTLLPRPFSDLVSVHSCNIESISYDICNGADCSTVSNNKEKITNSTIKFPLIKNPMVTRFRVGALMKQGDNTPAAIFYDPPGKNIVEQNGYFQFKTIDIPQAEVCLEGMTAASVYCDMEFKGDFPSLKCKRQSLTIDKTKIMTDMDPLSNYINCNTGKTFVHWNTSVLSRTFSMQGKTWSDSQTIARPELHLEMDYCNMGVHRVHISSSNKINLAIIKFAGDLTSIECEGFYNRNGMGMLTVNTNDMASGMLRLDCGKSVSSNCIINMDKTKSCNVTILNKGTYTCSYGSKHIEMNCDNLAFMQPDLASSTVIKGSGSYDYNTWETSVISDDMSWWMITLIVIGSIATFAMFLGFLKCIMEIYALSKMDSETGKPYANINKVKFK